MSETANSTDRDSLRNKTFTACRGLFLEMLYYISQEVHPGFGIQRQALDYVEELIIRLLLEIVDKKPHTVSDVARYVERTFPKPINLWAVTEAHDLVMRNNRLKHRQTKLPTPKVHLALRDYLGYKIDSQVISYITGVLVYIGADILKLTGNYIKNIRHNEITLQDLKVAMRADTVSMLYVVLMDLFYRDDEEPWSASLTTEDLVSKRISSLSYEQIVRDLVHCEVQFLRDVNMIVRVFRRALVDVLDERSQEIEVIFSNILDIQEFTARFLGSLEDTVEMCRELETPYVGNCFLEMAEGNEFEIYSRYVDDILSDSCTSTLTMVLQRPNVVNHLESLGSGFYLAYRYLLPKLLVGPIFHCLKIFEYLSVSFLTNYINDYTACLRIS
ncbi:unnamed protein product [Soboliphyme baturini]|uniref:DH domain-containing protein n=1 Tax=Soboliphyme baturini TaxID=241478 RepID=A0A183J048_9BILA|nr:unnamed protein product [Soboliphyme baturini]